MDALRWRVADVVLALLAALAAGYALSGLWPHTESRTLHVIYVVVAVVPWLAAGARVLRARRLGGLMDVGVAVVLGGGGVLFFDPWLIIASFVCLMSGVLTMVSVEEAKRAQSGA